MAVSLDDLDGSRESQAKFPHLTIVSDKAENLAKAAELLAPPTQKSHDGGDTLAPTTILVDRQGEVRAVMRPDRFIERFSPDDLLKAVKDHFPQAASALWPGTSCTGSS